MELRQACTLIVFAGHEPQLCYTPDGAPVVSFSLGTRQVVSKERSSKCPEDWKESLNGHNGVPTAEWIVAIWRRSAVCLRAPLDR